MGYAAEPGEAIDAVYTWVDGAAPGHAEQLAAHAESDHDRNPNRTRDNLELLRFSLRSLARYAPWLRRVHLFTMRPQRPRWLDPGAPGLHLVHHDQVFAPGELPTFSSFAIVSRLHQLPGLSRRFLYLEDDVLLGRPVAPGDFHSADGRLQVPARGRRGESGAAPGDDRTSPWNAAIAHTCRLLDGHLGPARRPVLRHGPLLFDRELCAALEHEFEDAFQRTRSHRFRRSDDVPLEILYPHVLLQRELAVAIRGRAARRARGYLGLGNWYLPVWAGLTRSRWRPPSFLNLNDNFGAAPNPRVEALVRRWLERRYPVPSRFERSALGAPDVSQEADPRRSLGSPPGPRAAEGRDAS